MPQHKSAEKRVRQSERRRVRNVQKRSQLKTAIKKVRTAENKETATAELVKTTRVLDKLAVKGIIHKKKAANLKSKLTRSIQRMP
jgi:small subunit ribosomal protein S20